MAYYDALKTKWATLTSTTTDAKLAEINALTVQGPSRPVPIADVMTYLRSNNLWLPIKASAAGGTSVGAAAAVDLNSDLRMQTIDMTLPLVSTMLADLVTHTLLTQDQANTLVAMGTPQIPWWQANGYTSPFNANDLEAAGGLT